MLRNKVKAVVGIILISSMLFGCGEKAAEEVQTTEVLVETQKAEKGSLSLVSGFVGTIEASESVNIIPMAAGTVTETFAEVGDMVEAGDVLFKIDDEAAQIQKEQAELNLKSVKQNAEMTTNTTAINNYSQVYNAQAAIDTAQIGYKSIKRNLNDARDTVDELEDTIDDMGTLKGQYNSYVAAYQAGVAAGDDPTDSTTNAGKAKDALVGLGGVLGVSVDPTNPASFAKIGSAIDSSIGQLESGLKEAKKGVDTLKDTKATTEISLKQAQQALQTICELQAATGGQVLQDQLQTGISLAALGVESADLALSFYEVTTPISGKIISKNVTTNGMASQQSVAYVVAQDDEMSTTFNVSEDVRNTLYEGKEIVVERNGKEFKGTITEVANAVDSMSGLFKIKAAVEANGEMLPNGVNVKINCETYSEDGVIIPYDAVYYDSEGSYVYLNKAGKATKTFVTCGIFDDENITILEGINVGDEVVVTWAANLSDGADLKVSDGSNSEVTDAN